MQNNSPSSREVSPTLTIVIIAVALLLILGGGYYFAFRPKDNEGISDRKMTPTEAKEFTATRTRAMDDYMRERNNRGKSGGQ